MLPELGHFALILALCLALLLMVLPTLGVLAGRPLLMQAARPLAVGQFVFVSLAFALLAIAFLEDDFSVRIVSLQSNLALPAFYKFAATWGGHEGSLVLWVWMLSVWTLAVAVFSRQLPLDMVARVLSVLGLVSVGFLLFSLLTSNPFERVLPNVPVDGRDLNPLLQDFAMIIHPPMLYCGYVGFSVVFAFALAALAHGRLDSAWARWSRPWTTLAWVFLTLGIMLGSWWAYYELGWGGWWFWDPVENASFMPWLSGTALLHSLAVTEKRGVFKSWTVLLAIFTFSLSLLGTFLVRSGVLTSVHSFAADPERGLFILGFLGVVVGGSLTLYAFRAPAVSGNVTFGSLSRELLLLINNVLLLTACLTVLGGTLFPLISEALNLGKYSVGPPYFNAVFVPLMAVLLSVMGAGVVAHWKKTELRHFTSLLSVAAGASIVVGLLFPFAYQGEFKPGVVLAVMLASWVLLGCVADLRYKLRHAASLSKGLKRLSASYFGMQIAHAGLAVSVIGICLTSHYSQEMDLRMAPGDRQQLGGYEFVFRGSRSVAGPNYRAEEGIIEVYRDQALQFTLLPQKRHYPSQGNAMTEAAIDPGLFRDVYVAMGEPLAGDAWAVRLHYKPFVRWIWLGAIIMAIGGVTAVCDRRYRQYKLRRADWQTASSVLPAR